LHGFHLIPPALAALFQVILIDIAMAGDNAVVIGLAAMRLPKPDRRKVIFGGLVAAVILRIVLAILAMTILLNHLGLMFAGGILLLWVAWRLYRDIHNGQDEEKAAYVFSALEANAKPPGTPCVPSPPSEVRRAIVQIALADVSMSLDNVLAVAGAAMTHAWVLIVGLILSIALMGFAASLVARLLQRHPWISYAGLTIVIYVALRMIWIGGGAILHAM
jgi:YjbE family integral membrane protein